MQGLRDVNQPNIEYRWSRQMIKKGCWEDRATGVHCNYHQADGEDKSSCDSSGKRRSTSYQVEHTRKVSSWDEKEKPQRKIQSRKEIFESHCWGGKTQQRHLSFFLEINCAWSHLPPTEWRAFLKCVWSSFMLIVNQLEIISGSVMNDGFN